MNILVVRTDKLGDFITALPTYYILKKYNPNNKIIACVAPLNQELAMACDFIDEVIIDRGQSFWDLVEQFRDAKIDSALALFSNTRIALALLFAGIATRIAPATKVAQFFYNHRVLQRRSQVKMAEFEYNLELTKELFPKIVIDFPQPLLQFDDNEVSTIYHEFCNKYTIVNPVIAFHPGFGGSSDANWTLDEYIELVKIVSLSSDIQAVMTFGPGEEKLRDEAMGKAKGLEVVFYQSDQGIVHFAKLLASFELFVSTSTGTYHLAAMVGTPTMTFFADTLFASVKRWKAISPEVIQHPYMLPADENRRKDLFLLVCDDLKQLIDTMMRNTKND